MVYRPNINPKLAFVLMPFKSPFESYFEEIIRPAAKVAGFEALKADQIYGTGPIIHDIWKQIWAASVVVADVTDKNPNVNYELGICHALGVPTVIITQDFNDVPFDYRHRRCIRYDTKEVNWQRKLKKSITATLTQVLGGEDSIPELSWPYETSPLLAKRRAGALVPGIDARDSVIGGVRLIRDAVCYAFGPQGAHVFLRVGPNQDRYLRRGVAIASAMHSSGRLEAIGMDHARELATEMRNSIGDGTKTAILLFYKMLDLGNTALKRKHSPPEVLRGMERAVETLVSAVRAQRKPATKDSLVEIAQTAAGSNSGIARLVAAAYEKVGSDGVVVTEQSNSVETTLEVQEGMFFDRGYLDDALLSMPDPQECILENAYILIYDRKISLMKELLPSLEYVAQAKKPLLIIAEDVDGEALATLVVNRQKNTLECLAVKSPGFGDRRKAVLQDIAVLTGGTVISVNSGRGLGSVTPQDFGRAKKVIVTSANTTILGGAGESKLNTHLKAIRAELSRAADPYAADKLRERLAMLGGAIASIKVGGISSQQVQDNSYAAESAMHSSQRAIEEGTVPGGGISLLRAKSALETLSFKKAGEVAGVNAVAEAAEEPLRQILQNGRVDPDQVLRKLKRAQIPAIGYNSHSGKLEDLSATGILDPVASVTRAVQLAFLHARTLLETAAWDFNIAEATDSSGEGSNEEASDPPF